MMGAALLCAAIGMGTAWAQTSAPSPMSEPLAPMITLTF
jgi:hypothetical protein